MRGYVMRPDETLEGLRQEAEKIAGVPIIITGGSVGRKDCHYRVPGETEYRPWGAWELFQTTYRITFPPTGTLVEGDKRYRLIDLIHAPTVYLAGPQQPPYGLCSVPGWYREMAKDRGMGWALTDINDHRPYRIRFTKENAPEYLVPFIHNLDDHIQLRADRMEATGVGFYHSGEIVVPEVMQKGWGQGFAYWSDGDTAVTQLEPPGQYTALPSMGVNGRNLMVLVDQAPKYCVVCRGDKGERRMLATLSDWGGGKLRPQNGIYAGCLEDTFSQWGKLLDGWVPPVKPPENSDV